MDKNSDAIFGEALHSEWKRLSTFANFPLKSPVHTTRLAEAGFYYQNKTDEVTCFSCGGKYSGWKEGDVPKYIHKQISPHCHFITGNQSGNVSVKQSQNKCLNGDSGSTASTSLFNGEINNSPSNVAITSSSSSANGACGISDDLSEHNARRGKPITANTSISDATSGRSSASDNNGRQNSETFSRETKNRHIQREQNVSTENGAQYRFNTMEQSSRSENPSHQLEAACLNNDIEPLGISTQRPVYPHYAITTVRLTSFRNWPKNKKQNPQDLARAGFFHEGTEDRVRCFFCGGGLVNWDPEDDPWIEHARWYPRCVYLRQNKGDNFILRVQEEVNKGQIDLSHLKDNGGDRRTQTDMMSHPAVLSVLDMGVNVELVKQAMPSLPLSTFSAEKLLLKVWELEEKLQQQNGEKLEETETQLTAENCHNEENEASSEISQNREKLQLKETSEINKAERIAIVEENRFLKELQLCKICLDEDVSIVFLPCGHMASCASCAPALRKCPICRAYIKGTSIIK
ncbi:hypothetical protein KUTeg_011310 [Tegillarca granosa]|uniref:RING-type domain-containing protein n=1 Tax=Tegillarca granosa TaxID=220873 RepID=A0ABQ9F3L3_TEGGR|nr:hypothetical protein KUTeg_011310 [Tegillarca granosa]